MLFLKEQNKKFPKSTIIKPLIKASGYGNNLIICESYQTKRWIFTRQEWVEQYYRGNIDVPEIDIDLFYKHFEYLNDERSWL